MRRLINGWSILFFGVVFTLAQDLKASGPVGFVAAVKGEAQVIRSTQSQTLWIGAEIFKNDVLVTGQKSRLKVLFSDDSLLALGANTRVAINSHNFQKNQKVRKTRIKMSWGSLRVMVQKLIAGNPANFEIHTSNAVAGVRGTEFAVVYQKDRTRLYTFSGEVSLTSGTSPPVLVAAGQGSQVNNAGRVSHAQALAKADLEAIRKATDTQQTPTALAWNLEINPKDRLVRDSSSVVSSSGKAQRPETPLEFQSDTGRCDGCSNQKDQGTGEPGQPSASENAFYGSGGTLYGDGQSFEFVDSGWNNADIEGPVHHVKLRIRVNR